MQDILYKRSSEAAHVLFDRLWLSGSKREKLLNRISVLNFVSDANNIRIRPPAGLGVDVYACSIGDFTVRREAESSGSACEFQPE